MSLRIIKTGLLDTIQDSGRFGYQHLGINPGGAMDRFSFGLANALLGKKSSPLLEVHFPAAQIIFNQPNIICIAGGDFAPIINDVEVHVHQPLIVREGDYLKFKQKRWGARCYISFYHELDIPLWMGSFSTHLKAACGGYWGRQLREGDEIAFKSNNSNVLENKEAKTLPWKATEVVSNNPEIKVVKGPEWNFLTEASKENFLRKDFMISPASDRMGYRLTGENLEQENQYELLSSAVTFGTIQLLPGGQLIVMMADHQTTGGYPRIAHVISAHLPRLAQLSPGDKIKFDITDLYFAEEKWIEQKKYLAQLSHICSLKMKAFLDAAD